MPSLSNTPNLGALLKYEGDNLYSREAATIASGQNLSLGTILGKTTADGKYHALDLAASDGSEIPVAILLTDTDATLTDRDDAIAIRRHAIVSRSALIWPAGILPAEKTAVEEVLESRGILVRDSA